jgi:DNA-binding transcriptional ArsR family regulator
MPAPGDEELGKLKQRRYEEVGLDRKAKYRALAKLKEAGLVSTRRVGNQSIEVTLLHTNGLIPGYEE